MIKCCKNCNAVFNGRRTATFCSKKCGGSFRTTSYTKQCVQCGSSFVTKPSANSNFCSRVCATTNARGKTKVERIQKSCVNCGACFDVMPHEIGEAKQNKKFCSAKCMGQYKSKQFGHPDINRTCKYCGKAFTVEKPCKKARFCSKECGYKGQKAENEEVKQQLIPLMKEYRKTHTPEETGEHFGMSASGVQQWGVLGPDTEKRLACPDKLTQEQHEVFVGNMLGDGSLDYLHSVGTNSKFSISQKIEFSEYVKALYEIYNPFSCGYYERETKKPSRVKGKISHSDENWDGEFLMSSRMYTVCHHVFTNYRLQWYAEPYQKGSQKIVPKEIKLTWRTAATWMCDDGSNHGNDVIKGRSSSPRYLMLHTESFTIEDVEFLIYRLDTDLGIKSTINKHEGKPTIRIGGDEWYEFVEGIKPFVPWECFQYKCVNRKKINKNISGYIGIGFHGGKWRATKSYRKNGKCCSVHIGSFATKEEAVEAREKWMLDNNF